jgi:centromeric protein E
LQIIDEKSLIKKYQTEIRRLKEELEQLKMGIITGTPSKDTGEDNIILWKQKVLCCFISVEPLLMTLYWM